ncbi:MAG: MFS transporter [Micrococcales bacterium]|nr:MFS transporter [Micrococcales bacterium]
MSTFGSLRVFNYRTWFIGAAIGNTGTWMQRVAQDWIVLTVFTNNDGLAVGIITALQFGPSLLVSPLAGVMADRFSQRKMLVVTMACQAVLAFALGVLMLLGWMNLWGMYAFATATGCVAGFQAPVFQTFVAQLVGRDLLPNAVGLNSANFNLARMVGPAVAGWALAVWSPGWVFIINALSFVANLVALWRMRASEMRPTPRAPKQPGQLRAGLSYVRGRSDILVILLVIGVVSCLGLNAQLTMGVMARVVFDRGPGQYGILGSLFAVGALCGSLLAARRRRPRVRLVLGAAMAFGIASGLSALAPTYNLFAACLMLQGLVTLTLITSANAAIQMSTAAEFRGRVMALYMMVFLGATPIGSPVVGWIANVWGPRWAIGVGSIASFAVGLGGVIWTMSRWQVTVRLDSWLPPHLLINNPASNDPAPPAPQR